MKRIIFLLACIVLFTNQGKAYFLECSNGHKYKIYSWAHDAVNYILKTDVLDQNTYGYAAVTVYLSDKTTIGKELRGTGGNSSGQRVVSGVITARGNTKITKVKLAVSGELKNYVIDLGNEIHVAGVMQAWGVSVVSW